MLQSPLETGNVGRTKSKLPFSLYNKQAFGEFILQFFDNGCRTIGRSVVDYKQVKLFG